MFPYELTNTDPRTHLRSHTLTYKRHRFVQGGVAASEIGDCVELLLDLDQGSMTVYKNDERLGVMVASGLSGEYCWAVSHYCGTVLIGGPEEGGRPVDADSGAIFRRFDLDRDGLLDREEMKAAAAAVCPPPHGSWHDELWDDFCAEWKVADPASGFDLAAFGRFHRFTRVTMPGANAGKETRMLFCAILYQNHHFAKTGSGQAGKAQKKEWRVLIVPEIPHNPFEPLEAPPRDRSEFYYDTGYDSGGDWESWDLLQNINDQVEFAASGLMQGEAAEVQQAVVAGWV